MAIPGINQKLDALASLVRAAAAGLNLSVTVEAPDKAPLPTDTYPIVLIFPDNEERERVATGQWGNVMPHQQPGAHGPDRYAIVILQSPIKVGLDEQGTKRTLNDFIVGIRRQIKQNPQLPDTDGNPTALDAAGRIRTHFGEQGQFVLWHQVAFVGALIVIDVMSLYESADD